MHMELVKNFTQSKIVKNIFIALIGTVLLAISSKIKIPTFVHRTPSQEPTYVSYMYDNA